MKKPSRRSLKAGPKESVPIAVVGSDEKKPRRKLLNKLVLIGACAALLAAGVVWYVTSHSAVRAVAGVTLGDDQSRYIGSDKATIQKDFESRTNLKLDDITQKPVSAARLKTFGLALEAGQALHGLQMYDRSEQAYAIAEKKATGHQADYNFYLEYADVADKDGQSAESDALLQKARQVLQADKTVSAATEKDELARIDQIVHLRKLGY